MCPLSMAVMSGVDPLGPWTFTSAPASRNETTLKREGAERIRIDYCTKLRAFEARIMGKKKKGAAHDWAF